MNTITLKYSGTEKTANDWGLKEPRFILRRNDVSSVLLDAQNGDPAGARIFPFEGQVEVWKDRTGSGTTWSGGTRIFVGYVTAPTGNAEGDRRSVDYELQDAWYFFKRIIFQQQWNARNSGDVSVNQKYYARCWLWFNFSTGGLITTAAQLTQIINFAKNQCGIAIQMGSADTLQNFPVQPARTMFIADVINICLQGAPDCNAWIDYTTNDGGGNPLPTINFTLRSNGTPVTLPYATNDLSGARSHKSSRIKRRDDLQVPSVVLQYQVTNPQGAITYLGITPDTYGIDSTGFTPRDVVAALDLRGFNDTFLNGQANAVGPVDPTTTAFWKSHKPDLADSSISGLSVVGGSTSVVDAQTGAAVSLATYPNELIGSGTIAPWMFNGSTQIVAREVKISAQLAYTKNNGASGPALTKITTHNVSTSIRLTNSATGLQFYRTLDHSDPGETAPQYLAYALFCSFNNVAPVITAGVFGPPPGSVPSITNPYNYQYEGEHIIVENSISNIYTPENTLNLTADPSTGNNPWVNMQAQIYEIEYDFFHGKTTIRFGPHKHLGPAEFFRNVMMFRVRMVYDNPLASSSGTDTGAGGQSITTDAQKQDTNHEVAPVRSLDTVQAPVSSDFVIVQKDAGNNGGMVYLAKVDSSGTKVVGTVDLRAALADVPAGSVNLSPTDGLPVVAFRQYCCQLTGGGTGSAWLLGSYPQ